MQEAVIFIIGFVVGAMVRSWPLRYTNNRTIARLRLSLCPSLASGACVYALYSNGGIVYIGHTRNLLRRIAEHRRSGKRFDSTRAYACRGLDSAILLEAHLIKLLSPPLNKSLL